MHLFARFVLKQPICSRDIDVYCTIIFRIQMSRVADEGQTNLQPADLLLLNLN